MKAVVVLALVVALAICVAGVPGNGNNGNNGGNGGGNCTPGGGADGCICTQDINPVCAGGKTYSNKCKAECDCFKPNQIESGECDGGTAPTA